MRELLRRIIALCLCECLIVLPVAGGARPDVSAPPRAEANSLRQYLQKPYLQLFELAPKLEFSAGEIQNQRGALEAGQKMCVSRFKEHSKRYGNQIEAAQKNLKQKTASLSDTERKQIHCEIQNLSLLKAEADVMSGHAIPTAYDNLLAKLDLIQKWPATYKATQQEVSSGEYMRRRWSDVKDIGFREIAAGQMDDVKRGQQAVEELKRSGMLPPAVENKAIQEYVSSVGQWVAKYSDLKVPLRVEVLQSKEINAFALPGGYLFVERGLLEAADDEAELAGVIAHEIAHDTARHSAKLMKRATIASILYQAAQVAAIILTGGAVGIGLYYALQYGFYGLGLVIDLKLLGVSRAYELEADQLGVQYAWNAGYDTTGFIRFFDKMATEKGYVNSVSWFRTHPPFYERMVETEREILFLPSKPTAVVQTSAFEQMKKALAPVAAAAEKEELEKPSLLLTRAEGCEPPKKLEYTPGQPVEELCAAPMREPTPSK